MIAHTIVRGSLPVGPRLNSSTTKGIRPALWHSSWCHSASSTISLQHRLHSAKARQRRDDIWIPEISLKKTKESLDVTDRLSRAGYLRQSHAGIYHILPLGLRVQTKLESLIDKHMQSIGASKVSLSSMTSQSLWQRSGRLNTGSEFFKFEDRKRMKWLLAPTHEEEITQLMCDAVYSPDQLPVRLYQISRKYRDEKRPRGGLLRGREFIMKDLYTFDVSQSEAHTTYDQVREAYRNLLDELTIPYVEARAVSGDMGGNLSHEYHFPNALGEDDVISCDTCGFARNEEWVDVSRHTIRDVSLSDASPATESHDMENFVSTGYLDDAKSSLTKVFARRDSINTGRAFNSYAVKAAMDSIVQLDTGLEDPARLFIETAPQTASRTVYYLFDQSISEADAEHIILGERSWLSTHNLTAKMVVPQSATSSNSQLLKQETGDNCPQCHTGKLQVRKAIEVGHTFHLGTRYSSKLGLEYRTHEKGQERIPVQMGCHGIGVSRLIAAVASSLSDETGLNWPAVIAPYQVVIVVDGNDQERMAAAEQLYDSITQSANGPFDVLLDDRKSTSMGYKLKDADYIGYPVIVVIGRAFANGQVEVQCRTRNQKETVKVDEAGQNVVDTLRSLLKTNV